MESKKNLPLRTPIKIKQKQMHFQVENSEISKKISHPKGLGKKDK